MKKKFSYTFETTEGPIIWIYDQNNGYWKLGKKAPPPNQILQIRMRTSTHKDYLPGTVTL